MSILSDARIKVEYLEDYYRRREAGCHPECEPLAVSEAAAMLSGLLAYAERREAQAIEEKARGDFYKGYMEFGQAHFWKGEDAPDFKEHGHATEKELTTYRELAALALSADLSSWHKITEEEREAIQDAIFCMRAEYGHDHAEAIKVLGGLIS